MEAVIAPPVEETTVLLRAIFYSSYSLVQYLVNRGCDVNAVTKQRAIRPLMMVCYVQKQRARLNILRFLLERGADPSLRDKSGRNALFYACILGREDVAARLLHNTDCDLVSVCDADGNTALHACTVSGSVAILELLLVEVRNFRLKVRVRNRRGQTPFLLAVNNGLKQLAEILREAELLIDQTSEEADFVEPPLRELSATSLRKEQKLSAEAKVSRSQAWVDSPMREASMKKLIDNFIISPQRSISYVRPTQQLVPLNEKWVEEIKSYETLQVQRQRKRISVTSSTMRLQPLLANKFFTRAVTSPAIFQKIECHDY